MLFVCVEFLKRIEVNYVIIRGLVHCVPYNVNMLVIYKEGKRDFV